MGDLQGTRTEENLRQAFTLEATSLVKYMLFAEDSDFEEIRLMFKSIARDEVEHAEVFLNFLGGLGDDRQNLKNAVALEGYVSSIDYPEAADIAEEEGFFDVASKFRDIAEIEKRHGKVFANFLNLVEAQTIQKGGTRTRWLCLKCGHIHIGSEPPDHCPVCDHEKKYFEKYDKGDYRNDQYTNL